MGRCHANGAHGNEGTCTDRSEIPAQRWGVLLHRAPEIISVPDSGTPSKVGAGLVSAQEQRRTLFLVLISLSQASPFAEAADQGI